MLLSKRFIDVLLTFLIAAGIYTAGGSAYAANDTGAELQLPETTIYHLEGRRSERECTVQKRHFSRLRNAR